MIDVNITPSENIIDVNLQTDDLNIDLEVDINSVIIDVNIDPAILGEKGDKGDKGDKGEQGEQGLQGIQGVKGDTGSQGIQGVQGIKGGDGEQGLQGIQGIQGEQGTQGIKGDTGEQGIQGIKGEKGDPSTPTRKQGFIDYNDTTGSIDLTADTWTTIPNNGLGSFTNKNFKPLNVSEFINTSTGDIDCSEVDLGDSILIRNDFQVNPNTNNSLLEFRYQLGNVGGLYTLETNLGRLDNGSGKNYRFSLKSDLIYMGDTNTRDNPISLQVKLSTDGTLTNAGTVIQLIKSVI